MKKLAILSLTFLFAVSVANGQTQTTGKENAKEVKKEKKTERVALKKLEGTVVSEKSKHSFNTDFSGATDVVSKRIDTYDEFAFTNKEGQKMKAFYDIDGILVGTTQIKTFGDVPVKGQQAIKKNYKDYTIGQVVFYDDNEANDTDMKLYGMQFDDKDNYFVELLKGTNKIVVQVNTEGDVFFFKDLI